MFQVVDELGLNVRGSRRKFNLGVKNTSMIYHQYKTRNAFNGWQPKSIKYTFQKLGSSHMMGGQIKSIDENLI